LLTYKAELVGIRVEVTEESYTSQASLLDLDPLPVRNNDGEKHTFSGKRLTQGCTAHQMVGTLMPTLTVQETSSEK
jgi:hypothetical protein